MLMMQSHSVCSNTRAAAKHMHAVISKKFYRNFHSNLLRGSQRQIDRGLPGLCQHHSMVLTRHVPLTRLPHSFSTVSDVHLNEATAGMEFHRQTIIRASLEKVHTLGWTQDAIVAAVLELQKQKNPNYSISMSGLCTPSDLISFCMEDWNDQLERYITTHNKSSGDPANQSKPKASENHISELESKSRLFDAYKFRLSLMVPFLQSRTWHEAMAMGLVQNTVTTHSQVHRVVELLCPLGEIDDKGNEDDGTITQSINRTGHQALLGAIYVSTELHMLTDSSLDYEDTWAFLQARIDDYYNCVQDGPLQGTMNQLIQSLSAAAGTSTPNSQSNPLTSLLQGPVVPAATAVVSSLLDGAASVFLAPNQQRQWKNATSHYMGTPVPFSPDVEKESHSSSPSSEFFGTNPKDYEPNTETPVANRSN